MPAVPATHTSIAAFLQLAFSGSATVQHRKHWPLLRLVEKVPIVDESNTWAVEFKRGDAAGASRRTPGADFGDEATPIRANAALDIAEYGLPFAVTDLAQGIARANNLATMFGIMSNSGSALMQSEAASAVVKVYDDLTADCYAGNEAASPPQVSGLDDVGGTSTWADINPATSGQEAWQGKNNTASLTDFNADPSAVLRETILSPIRDVGGSARLAFCRSGLIDAILDAHGGMEALTRIQFAGTELPVAEIGARIVNVDSCYFVEDPSAPANKVHVISPESIFLGYVDQRPKMDLDEIAAGVSRMLGITVDRSAVEQLLNMPMLLPQLYFTPLARTGTKDKVGVAGQFQWRVPRREHHGVLSLS